MRLIKRLIKAEKEVIDYEGIANRIFNTFDLNLIKDEIMDAHSEIKKEYRLTNIENEYTIYLLPVFPEATDQFEIAHHFADYVFTGYFSTEPLTSKIFDEIWESANQVFNLVAKKLTDSCGLDGYFYFDIYEDGTYSLFYHKPNFKREEEVVETLEESIESYEDKRRRMEELPGIIEQALENRDRNVFMSATEELNQLKEFFKEAKRKYRLKRLTSRR
jgi:hypothetical protein